MRERVLKVASYLIIELRELANLWSSQLCFDLRWFAI